VHEFCSPLPELRNSKASTAQATPSFLTERHAPSEAAGASQLFQTSHKLPHRAYATQQPPAGRWRRSNRASTGTELRERVSRFDQGLRSPWLRQRAIYAITASLSRRAGRCGFEQLWCDPHIRHSSSGGRQRTIRVDIAGRSCERPEWRASPWATCGQPPPATGSGVGSSRWRNDRQHRRGHRLTDSPRPGHTGLLWPRLSSSKRSCRPSDFGPQPLAGGE